MAIFHATTKPLGRASGRSSVAASAYRAGVSLLDERTGNTHDFTRKAGVVSAEVLTPAGPVDRSELWNAAEAAEKRSDSRTAREWIVALPAELDAGQRHALAVGFASELVSRYGVAADVAIHEPSRNGDDRNHHAHILTTTRSVEVGPDGSVRLGEKTAIELSDSKRRQLGMGAGADEVTALRQVWERHANRALEAAGSVERVDARSLAAQGVERDAQQHQGPKATAIQRRGETPARGRYVHPTPDSMGQAQAQKDRAREVGQPSPADAQAKRQAQEQAERIALAEAWADKTRKAERHAQRRADRLARVARGRHDEAKAFDNAARTQRALAQSAEENRGLAWRSARDNSLRVEVWKTIHPVRTRLGWRSKEVKAWEEKAQRQAGYEKDLTAERDAARRQAAADDREAKQWTQKAATAAVKAKAAADTARRASQNREAAERELAREKMPTVERQAVERRESVARAAEQRRAAEAAALRVEVERQRREWLVPKSTPEPDSPDGQRRRGMRM